MSNLLWQPATFMRDHITIFPGWLVTIIFWMFQMFYHLALVSVRNLIFLRTLVSSVTLVFSVTLVSSVK